MKLLKTIDFIIIFHQEEIYLMKTKAQIFLISFDYATTVSMRNIKSKLGWLQQPSSNHTRSCLSIFPLLLPSLRANFRLQPTSVTSLSFWVYLLSWMWPEFANIYVIYNTITWRTFSWTYWDKISHYFGRLPYGFEEWPNRSWKCITCFKFH